MNINYLNKLILAISFIFVANIPLSNDANAQGCGNHTAYGSVQCLDYKNRSINLSNCNAHTSEIGSRPSRPTARCPNTCCTETHRVDGVIQGTPEIKVAGTCNNTSRTTTCEERGDCAPETCTETHTLDGTVVSSTEKPTGTCNDVVECTQRTYANNVLVSSEVISGNSCADVNDNTCIETHTLDGVVISETEKPVGECTNVVECTQRSFLDGVETSSTVVSGSSCTDTHECTQRTYANNVLVSSEVISGNSCADINDNTCIETHTLDGVVISETEKPVGECTNVVECTQRSFLDGVETSSTVVNGSSCTDTHECTQRTILDGNVTNSTVVSGSSCSDVQQCTQRTYANGVLTSSEIIDGNSCADINDDTCVETHTLDGAVISETEKPVGECSSTIKCTQRTYLNNVLVSSEVKDGNSCADINNRTCIETHTLDGAVISETEKPDGECSNTVKCTQRTFLDGNLTSSKVENGASCSDRILCTPATTVVDRRDQAMGCDPDQTGNMQHYFEKHRIVTANCDVTVTDWIKVGESGECLDIPTCTEEIIHHGEIPETESCPPGQIGTLTNIYQNRYRINTDCSHTPLSKSARIRQDGSCQPEPDFGGDEDNDGVNAHADVDDNDPSVGHAGVGVGTNYGGNGGGGGGNGGGGGGGGSAGGDGPGGGER